MFQVYQGCFRSGSDRSQIFLSMFQHRNSYSCRWQMWALWHSCCHRKGQSSLWSSSRLLTCYWHIHLSWVQPYGSSHHHHAHPICQACKWTCFCVVRGPKLWLDSLMVAGISYCPFCSKLGQYICHHKILLSLDLISLWVLGIHQGFSLRSSPWLP